MLEASLNASILQRRPFFVASRHTANVPLRRSVACGTTALIWIMLAEASFITVNNLAVREAGNVVNFDKEKKKRMKN